MEIWDRTRRNHGLEHATIAIMMERGTAAGLVGGNSIHDGFFVFGNVDTSAIEVATAEALARMGRGEGSLAVSPFCGTNMVVAAALTSIGAVFSLQTAGRGPNGWSRAFSNAMFGLFLSRPMGRWVQRRYTTSPNVSGMSINKVSAFKLGKLTIHKVSTAFDQGDAAQASSPSAP